MLFKVPEEKIVYSNEPEDSIEYTEKLDKEYSKYVKAYDIAVKLLPVWKTWIKAVIPYIEGSRVLEALFVHVKGDALLKLTCSIRPDMV